MYFRLCLLPLVVSLGTTEKNLSLLPSVRYFKTWIGSPLSLLFSRLKSQCALSLSSYESCFEPLITFVALCWSYSSMLMSLLHWGAQH